MFLEKKKVDFFRFQRRLFYFGRTTTDMSERLPTQEVVIGRVDGYIKGGKPVGIRNLLEAEGNEDPFHSICTMGDSVV
jgi:hypothetical protein